MKKVIIKSIELNNFKGFYDANMDFDEKTNVFYGESGCGKSTIKDAWLWVCGIDVESPNPSIENKVIPNLITRVECRISVGEVEYKISRKSLQKWKEIDGENVFNGFTSNQFEIDGIAMTATAYRDKICEIFGLEKYEYIRFLCDTHYFNNDIDYKKRRAILFKIGEVAEKTAKLNEQPEFELIREDLNKGFTSSDIAKAINSSEKAISTAKKENCTRIAERASDLAIDYDFVALKEEQKKLESEYKLKHKEFQELEKREKEILIRKQIAEVESEISKLELADMRAKNNYEIEKTNKELELERIKTAINATEAKLNIYDKQKEEIESSEYTAKICPVCKQEIKTTGTEEEAIAEFEKHKTASIKEIGLKIQEEKIHLSSLKEEYEKLFIATKSDVGFKANPQIEVLQKDKEKLQLDLAEEQANATDNKELKFELQELESRIREVSSKLAFEKVKESADLRIKQLEKENLKLAQIEKENTLKRRCNENYLIAIISMVNESINSMFDVISWNLFDTFNADAEKNYREECEAVFDERLYKQCSTGQKLIADFYTTIGLQKAFGVSMPIFFDEAQSSTFERNCEQQLIELVTMKKETNIKGTRIESKC